MTKNYFAILGLEEKFDLSIDIIRQKYFASQKSNHPDRRSKNIKRSIAINEAYSNLIDPLSRAQHIFELNGMDVITGTINPRILSLMLDAANNFELALQKMQSAFENDDLRGAYDAWCECQYLRRAAERGKF